MDVIDMIAIKQAYEDGAQIEYKHRIYDKTWVLANAEPTWNWNDYEYRIKDGRSEECVPYKNADEFHEAERQHGPGIVFMRDVSEEVLIPRNAINSSVCICSEKNNSHIYTKYTCLADMKLFRWQDGSPCGKTMNA